MAEASKESDIEIALEAGFNPEKENLEIVTEKSFRPISNMASCEEKDKQVTILGEMKDELGGSKLVKDSFNLNSSSGRMIHQSIRFEKSSNLYWEVQPSETKRLQLKRRLIASKPFRSCYRAGHSSQ